MHPTTQIPAPPHGSASAENLPPPVEITPELIDYHIQLGRRLRSEALARLTARLAHRVGAVLSRALERQERLPHVGPAVR